MTGTGQRGRRTHHRWDRVRSPAGHDTLIQEQEDGAMRDKLAFSVEEVAGLLSLGRSTVFELVRTGELGSIKLGHRRLITQADLDEFLQRARAESRATA
jgi:excisionase family DNA binding protein